MTVDREEDGKARLAEASRTGVPDLAQVKSIDWQAGTEDKERTVRREKRQAGTGQQAQREATNQAKGQTEARSTSKREGGAKRFGVVPQSKALTGQK